MISYTVEMLNRSGKIYDQLTFPTLAKAADFLTDFHKQARERDLKVGVDYNLRLKESVSK